MTLIDILIVVAIAAVAITLGFGLYSLFRGGEFARSHSNRLMRLRVALQALAIVILLVALFLKGQGG